MESVSKSLEDVSVASLAGYINARLSLDPTSNPTDICNEIVQKALCTGEKRSGIIPQTISKVQSYANTTVAINKPILPSVQPTNGCQYQYKRGDNRGKYCGRAVIPGTNYCSKCSNNKSVQNLKNQTVIPQTQVTIPQVKFSPQASTTHLTNLLHIPSTIVPGSQAPQISVTNQDKSVSKRIKIMAMGDGFLKEEGRNLKLLPASKTGSLLCSGKYSANLMETLPLSKEDEEYCRKLNISIVDQDKTGVKEATTFIPQQGNVISQFVKKEDVPISLGKSDDVTEENDEDVLKEELDTY